MDGTLKSLTSCQADLVSAICTSLSTRNNLCVVCESASAHISDFLFAFDNADTKPSSGLMGWHSWPPRDFNHLKSPRNAYTDGLRMLPPTEIKPDGPLPANVFKHYDRPNRLLESARSCGLCEMIRIAIIMDCFREKGFPFDTATEPFADLIRYIMIGVGSNRFERVIRGLRESEEPVYLILEDARSFKRGATWKTGFKLENLKVVWQKPKNMFEKTEREIVYTRLNVFCEAPRGEEIRRYVSSRRPLNSSCSTDALELMRNWARKCLKHHSRCRGTISRGQIEEHELHRLPTRVIDVGCPGSEDEPRLVETAGYPKGHWVALSHCWGSSEHHPPKTTKTNLNEHKEGIAFSKFPKTFLEAIILTRALGFRYLWADSLCIVQDDVEDWLLESKNMGLVYQHAVITLAASGAENSSEGLFIPRDYRTLQIASVQFPLVRKGSVLGHYHIALEWRQEPFLMPMDPFISPLSVRGWVTQELVLSRRVIHFLDRGMVWVCKTHAEDEAGSMLVGRGIPESDWCTEWGKLISEHSARNFTFPKDRIIALEGLAREIAKQKGLKQIMPTVGPWKPIPSYAFGIFEVDMPEYLIWEPMQCSAKLDFFPSWSWASHDGPIFLRFRDFDSHREDANLSSDCKVLRIDGVSGVLHLEARRIRVDRFLKDRVPMNYTVGTYLSYRSTYLQHYKIVLLDEKDSCGWAYFDHGELLEEYEEIWFLHLMTAEYCTGPKEEGYGLLIVRKMGLEKEAYVRVGLAACSDFSWVKNEPKLETILL